MEDLRDPTTFTYCFDPAPAQVWLARTLLADWLGRQQLRATEIDDTLVICSELCTNALEHVADGDAAIQLRAWHQPTELVLEVESEGAAGGGWLDGPDHDPRVGGELRLAAALGDGLEVRQDGIALTVRATKRTALVS